MTAPGAAGPKSTGVRLTGIGLLAAGVAVALYAAGRLHTPNYTISLFGQVGLDAVALKSTLSSVALGLAGLQVLLALWIYRKLPLAGSFFYGAFAAKVLLVQSRRLPGWVLPVAGGILAILVGVLWYTSALWYYNGFHLPA